MRRRTLLQALAAAGLAGLPRLGTTGEGATAAAAPGCGDRPGVALPQPGDDGWFARWRPGESPAALTARTRAPTAGAPWTRAFDVSAGSRRLLNPTLVVERGQKVEFAVANAMDAPTIVHWHGLAIDSRNDGALGPLVAPGASTRYAFEIRDRAGLYWYHPHPHGATAGQAYDGLLGLIEVGDDEERALRKALDVVPGDSELVLVLQDRRAAGEYAASDDDRVHGLFGSCITVNGVEGPTRAVATRGYRLRFLNASNARTYRLAFTTAGGAQVPMTLLGTDGGLLAAPIRCRDLFLSPAERIDVHVDFAALSVGDAVVLETTAFDPMHMEVAARAAPPPSASHDPNAGHGAGTPVSAGEDRHAGHAMSPVGHAIHGTLAEGARAAVMVFTVRERASSPGRVPAVLSSLAAPVVDGASERPLRLGYAKGRWRINDKVFEMGGFPIEVARGAREIWLFRNYYTSMPHAMHLHGFHFRVIARETSPDAIAALAVDDRGRLPTDLGAKDTVLVWPGESVRAVVDFAMPFEGPQGYLVHCHNLEHEDGGMMLGVRVA
jgi:suppressor of ftsI/bilirubin oxidase